MRGKIVLDRLSEIRYNKTTSRLQESPIGMASASQADLGGSLRSTPSTAQRAQALPFPTETGSNSFIKCRNRIAVWRQLPKLILAGSTPVSCSSMRAAVRLRVFQEAAPQADFGGSLQSTPSTAQRAQALPFPTETGSNSFIKCRNRLAVWRQLPKLISAGRCEARRAPHNERRLCFPAPLRAIQRRVFTQKTGTATHRPCFSLQFHARVWKSLASNVTVNSRASPPRETRTLSVSPSRSS